MLSTLVVEAIARLVTCEDLPSIFMVMSIATIMVVSHEKWWCYYQKGLDLWLINALV